MTDFDKLRDKKIYGGTSAHADNCVVFNVLQRGYGGVKFECVLIHTGLALGLG